MPAPISINLRIRIVEADAQTYELASVSAWDERPSTASCASRGKPVQWSPRRCIPDGACAAVECVADVELAARRGRKRYLASDHAIGVENAESVASRGARRGSGAHWMAIPRETDPKRGAQWSLWGR
jgi:hypothetical protein